jgi:hypothetical protein
MAYLFAKDMVTQSLHLGFAGAWREAFPDLQDPLQVIRQYCPELIESFLPPSERTLSVADNDVNVQQDPHHRSVKVSIDGFLLRRDTAMVLQLHRYLDLSALSPSHPFIL